MNAKELTEFLKENAVAQDGRIYLLLPTGEQISLDVLPATRENQYTESVLVELWIPANGGEE